MSDSISIGATRLYWQLREAGLIGTATSSVQALVTQMDEAQLPAYLALASELRQAGINTEVVMEPSKLGKQFKHADRQRIPFVVTIGPEEAATGEVKLKEMQTGREWVVPLERAIEKRNRVNGARQRREGAAAAAAGDSPDNRS